MSSPPQPLGEDGRATIGRPREVLLVEDQLLSARMTAKQIQLAGFPHRLTWLRDGGPAWRFLKNEGPYARSPRPELLLLDLTLQSMHGPELLHKIRSDDDPAIRRLDVIVLSADECCDEIADLAVTAYLAKSGDPEAFLEAIDKSNIDWHAGQLADSDPEMNAIVEDESPRLASAQPGGLLGRLTGGGR